MKYFTILAVYSIPAIVFGLLILAGWGCASNDLATVRAEAQIARDVIAGQPAGPKRDKLLQELDTALMGTDIAILAAKTAEAKAAATQPTK